MGLRKILVGLVAVATLLTVSGCSTSPNAAATVDGQVVTEEYVQSTAVAVSDILSQNPSYLNFDFVGFVLNNKIRGMVLTDALNQMGITITDADRDQFWASGFTTDSVEYPLWTDEKTKDAMAGYIDFSLVNSAIQAGSFDADKLLELMNAVSVTLNPRYGDWDSEYLAPASRVTGQSAGPLADPVPFTIPA